MIYEIIPEMRNIAKASACSNYLSTRAQRMQLRSDGGVVCEVPVEQAMAALYWLLAQSDLFSFRGHHPIDRPNCVEFVTASSASACYLRMTFT